MKLIFAAVAVSALMSAPAFANMDMAKKNACMACHAVDKKVVGPSYKMWPKNTLAKKTPQPLWPRASKLVVLASGAQCPCLPKPL
jgi:hypothetical protein